MNYLFVPKRRYDQQDHKRQKASTKAQQKAATMLNSPISHLPAELKAHIIDHLPTSDVSNLRRASKSWARVGIRGLFKFMSTDSGEPGLEETVVTHGVLTINHNVDAATRLREISIRPWLAIEIREVRIFLVYNDWISTQGLFELGTSNETQTVFSDVFSRFPNLRTLNIELQDNDRMCYGINLGLSGQMPIRACHASHLCLSILSAANKIRPPIKRLVLQEVPIEAFLLQNMRRLLSEEQISEGFKDGSVVDEVFASNFLNIERLNMSMVNAGGNGEGLAAIPNTNYSPDYSALGQFLALFQSIKSLEIRWPDVDTQLSYVAIECLTSQLHPHFYSHLQTLKIYRPTKDAMSLAHFIRKHSKSLKHLLLGQYPLPERMDYSLKSFLTVLRDELRLESFLFLSPSYSMTNNEYEFSRCSWHSEIMPAQPRSVANLFEMFVLTKCSWPMMTDFPPAVDAWKVKPEWNFLPKCWCWSYEEAYCSKCSTKRKTTAILYDMYIQNPLS